jgi:hypothetical protein
MFLSHSRGEETLKKRTGCSLDMHEGFPSFLPDRVLTVENRATADLGEVCVRLNRCLIEIMRCLKSKALFSFKLSFPLLCRFVEKSVGRSLDGGVDTFDQWPGTVGIFHAKICLLSCVMFFKLCAVPVSIEVKRKKLWEANSAVRYLDAYTFKTPKRHNNEAMKISSRKAKSDSRLPCRWRASESPDSVLLHTHTKALSAERSMQEFIT